MITLNTNQSSTVTVIMAQMRICAVANHSDYLPVLMDGVSQEGRSVMGSRIVHMAMMSTSAKSVTNVNRVAAIVTSFGARKATHVC